MTDWIRKNFPAIVLAPMEGMTDPPMRALMTELVSLSFCVSEFLRVSQEVPPARVYFRHLPELANGCRTASGTPVQLQLLGGNAERLASTAALATSLGVTAIDLNFGCPAPTVNNHDGGATLLKCPERIYEIVRSVRSAVPSHIPVSAKLRLGWENPKDVFLNAEKAQLAGASWITIHARTRMQGYRPPVFWELIGEVRKNSDVPVVANGDVWTFEDFLRCREATGCSHFMLGRGALANPKLVFQVGRELGLAVHPPDFAWGRLVQRFAELSHPGAPHAQDRSVGRVKQWLKMVARQDAQVGFERIKYASSIDSIVNQLPCAS